MKDEAISPDELAYLQNAVSRVTETAQAAAAAKAALEGYTAYLGQRYSLGERDGVNIKSGTITRGAVEAEPVEPVNGSIPGAEALAAVPA